MSKAITRPAKAATQTPAPVVAVEPVEEQEIARIKLAFRALDSILWSASQTPLDETGSGDSDRLLRTASTVANDLASDNTDDDSGALKNEARTIAALVRASRMVPDDIENAARREWIERAGVLLAQITGDPVETTIYKIFVDGSEVNANDAAGAMGTLQFAQQRLGECMEIVGEMSRPLDDLYWGTFCAHSLVSLLEDHCWADAWKWTMPADVLSGTLSAARDSVEKAIGMLVAEGATQ